MCGIIAVWGSTEPTSTIRDKVCTCAKRIQHRGPDWSGVDTMVTVDDEAGVMRTTVLYHQLLAITDVDSGEQPLYSASQDVMLICNGEIYNHKQLKQQLPASVRASFKTESDCEAIVQMYSYLTKDLISAGDAPSAALEEKITQIMTDMCQQLDGIFSFVLADKRTGQCYVARDPIGVTSLYYGWGADGSVWIASELKALSDQCVQFAEFPPGHWFSTSTKSFTRYYRPSWWDDDQLPASALSPSPPPPEAYHDQLRTALEHAVKKRMMCNVPYGVLLSGGLDSSLVASIAAQFAPRRVEDEDQTPAWFPRLHSFSIGLRGSPDLAKAREAAAYLGTVHHEWHFTPEQGIDAIPDVVYHLETYDVTTIRASTPMYLLSRRIKSMGIKMVLSGEGADEIFGGYLYFHKAPNAEEFHKETVRKLKLLHYYDCLRANKSTAAWGVEVRVPFLDKKFLDVAMTMPPQHKMVKRRGVPSTTDDGDISLDEEDEEELKKLAMEKYILRKSFDCSRSTVARQRQEFAQQFKQQQKQQQQQQQQQQADYSPPLTGYGAVSSSIPTPQQQQQHQQQQKDPFSPSPSSGFFDIRQDINLPDRYLPDNILWRQKEQFSDGVGYDWIDSLKAYAEQRVTDAELLAARYRFPHNTPQTKEAYWYRTIFESHFAGQSAEKTVPWGPSIACSTPTAVLWDEAWAKQADPSGRSIAGVHVAASASKSGGSSSGN